MMAGGKSEKDLELSATGKVTTVDTKDNSSLTVVQTTKVDEKGKKGKKDKKKESKLAIASVQTGGQVATAIGNATTAALELATEKEKSRNAAAVAASNLEVQKLKNTRTDAKIVADRDTQIRELDDRAKAREAAKTESQAVRDTDITKLGMEHTNKLTLKDKDSADKDKDRALALEMHKAEIELRKAQLAAGVAQANSPAGFFHQPQHQPYPQQGYYAGMPQYGHNQYYGPPQGGQFMHQGQPPQQYMPYMQGGNPQPQQPGFFQQQMPPQPSNPQYAHPAHPSNPQYSHPPHPSNSQYAHPPQPSNPHAYPPQPNNPQYPNAPQPPVVNSNAPGL